MLPAPKLTRRAWGPVVGAALVGALAWPAALVTQAPARAAGAFSGPVVALSRPCPSQCFEPTVAVDRQGRIFVAVGYDTAASPGGGRLAVSTDGGRHFSYRPTPPNPAPAGTFVGDATVVVAPTGRLYYYAIVGAANGTPVPLWFYGVEVAYSDDGARTWASNALVSLPGPHPAAMVLPDRPWLGFGAGRTVWLSYNQQDSSELVLRSDDGGRTFPQVAVATTTPERGTWGQAGPVVYDPRSGRLYLPYLTQAEAGQAASGRRSAVRVAVSTDGGRSFASHDVYRPASAPAGEGFPILSVDRSGGLSAVWATYNGTSTTVIAYSADHGVSWAPPSTWTPPEPAASPTITCPWIASSSSATDVMAYHYDGKAIDAWFATAVPKARPAWSPLALGIGVISGSANSGAACNTDFADFAIAPDGCAVAVWADPKVGVLVSSQTASLGSRLCSPVH